MPDRPPRSSAYAIPKARTDDAAERARFYNGARWLRVRALVLRARPLCRHCEDNGLVAEATVVHHVLERLDRPDLAYEPSNLEGLCGPCHRVEHNRRKGNR